MNITEKLLVRFWQKVKRRGPDDCWEWAASRSSSGYGVFVADKARRPATHVVLHIAGRPRPDKLLALHTCDNPPCVNPSHLYWGTDKQNTEDKRARGRLNNARGSRAGNAKLDDEKVLDILTNNLTLMECAEKYNVTFGLIGAIRQRRIWTHVIAEQPRSGFRRGSEFRRAKLDEDAVRDIRASDGSQQATADKYGVSQTLIGMIRRRLIWKHI